MKRLLLLVFLFPLLAFADGGTMVFMKVDLTFENGNTAVKYFSLPDYAYKPDSLSHSEYVMEKVLAWQSYQDSVTFFNEWVTFDHTFQYGQKEKMTVVELFGRERFALAKIKKATVEKVHEQAGGWGFGNRNLSEKDMQWMQQKPHRVFRTGSFSCDFTFYQFEEDPMINKFLLDFIARGQLTEGFEEQTELINSLKALNGRRILIVSVCTC